MLNNYTKGEYRFMNGWGGETATVFSLVTAAESFFKNNINFVFYFFYRHIGLWDMLSSKHSVLLYPSQKAIDINDLPKEMELHNVFILDGTWPQAKAIYNNTQMLQSMIHVSIQSQY